MATRFALVLLFVTSALIAAPKPVEPPGNPQEKLETAIPHGIKLLEAKMYAEFLKTYAPPEFTKKFDGDALKEVAEKFGKDKAGVLLDVLKEIKGQTPKLSEDGKTATFTLKKEINGRTTINWIKSDKSWYIGN